MDARAAREAIDVAPAHGAAHVGRRLRAAVDGVGLERDLDGRPRLEVLAHAQAAAPDREVESRGRMPGTPGAIPHGEQTGLARGETPIGARRSGSISHGVNTGRTIDRVGRTGKGLTSQWSTGHRLW